MRWLTRSLRRFRSEDHGSVVAEGVIALPLMIWAYMGLYVYWDAFRAVNLAQKASYTISDYISRERGTLSAAEIAGLAKVFQYMMDDDQTTKMRITSIYWNPETNRFEVYWSRSPGSTMTPLTTTTLQAVRDRIPMMADGDSAILLETETTFTPSFQVGVEDQVFQNFIVTRPRFLPRICLTDVAC
jgi:Flp pilus assembly protein TadG